MKFGNIDITDLKVGTQEVQKLYVGENLVWDGETIPDTEISVLNSILSEVFTESAATPLDAYNEWNRQFTNQTKAEYAAPATELESINLLDEFYGGSGTHTNKLTALNSIHSNMGGSGANATELNALVGIKAKMFETLNSLSFQIELETTTSNRSVTLPTHEKSNEIEVPEYLYNYNYVVDWGDGTVSTAITTWNDPQATHVYATAGKYVVKITGLMECFIINDIRYPGSYDTRFLWTKVISWGNVGAKEIAFGECDNLRHIPRDKMGAFTNLIHAKVMFMIGETPTYHGAGIQRIPKRLLDHAVNITRFHYTFHGLAIHEIPDNLFDFCDSVMMFQTAFEYCREVQNIPEELFRYNINTTNFTWVFNGLHALEFIPEKIFYWNTEARLLKAAFGETRVSSIPVDLFRYNIKATDLSGMFYAADGITTLPVDIFRYNTEALDMSYIFDGSPTIMDIPEDLFKYNTKVTTFWALFRNTNIRQVPAGIFRHNELVTNFSYAFKDCKDLQSIPTNLFINNPVVTDFRFCFAENTSATGFFPKLWISHPDASSLCCFEIYGGQSSLTESKYIPAAWAGDSNHKGLIPIVKNGGFDKDVDWIKNGTSSISAGVGTVQAQGTMTSNQGGLVQTTADRIMVGDKVSVTFKARQISGTGKFQFGMENTLFFDQNITGTWHTYAFDFIATSAVSQINFGGQTSGDVFEIDDILLKRVVDNGSFDENRDWYLGVISGGIATITGKGMIDTSYNWSLYQELSIPIPNGTSITVIFKARRTSGSGNLLSSLHYQLGFDAPVTSSWVEYSYSLTTNSQKGTIVFGGETVGDTFEIDDVMINYN